MKNTQWKKQVEESFGGAAPSYDQYAEIQRYVAAQLMELCPDSARDILEIGCGTGALTYLLTLKYPSSHITASDISAQMINQARAALASERIEWQVMDGENPTLNNQYDLIIANMVFQWFEDREVAIENLKQHLKPGGQILYSMPGPDTFTEWRTVLKELNLPCGLLNFEKPGRTIKEETLSVDYKNAFTFLKNIKKIGAHKPNLQYQTIGTALKKACTKFDEDYQGKLTWHIIYTKRDG